jgi:hypothetical protein
MLVAVVIGVVLSGQAPAAEDLSRYREFVLGSSLASVAKISGVRPADIKVVHRRPAMIQELAWRPPYALTSSRIAPDPVREAVFSFYNDQLFRIAITYERERTEGLTDRDVIDAVSVLYGAPVIPSARRPLDIASRPGSGYESTTVAQWLDTDNQVTLSRGTYPGLFRIVAVARKLEALAQAASLEADRLDADEAPARDADRRKKEIADAIAAQEKARVVNKPAFRP